MTWVKIDDGALHHPKLLRAGPEGVCLWLAGLCYANAHTTDGLVPGDALGALYPVEGWTRPKLLRLAEKLVEVGLWHPVDGGGYLIHDYGEFQAEAMRSAVEDRRAYEREKKRRQRERPDGTPNGTHRMSLREADGTGRSVPRGVPTGVPGVSPAPGPARPKYPPTPQGGPVSAEEQARRDAVRARLAAAAKGDA